MTTKDRLLAQIDSLIAQGERLKWATEDPDDDSPSVEIRDYTQWQVQCKNLIRMLGTFAQAWSTAFDGRYISYNEYLEMVGLLDGLRQLVDENLLIRVENLVLSEEFDNLLAQAEYLLDKGFFLAAGVLGRAVLEDHLRNWCQRVSCTPALPNARKPTLGDFNAALYKDNHYMVATMKHLDAMIAVGNKAAHNEASLTVAEVERLLRDVRDFLGRNPLP